MDSKRPYKYRAVGRLFCWGLVLSCLLMASSCTWVKDDNDDCPYGFWLNLHYTYNILDVEAAPAYVKDVSVFVYDSVGNYVTRIDVQQPALNAFGHRVRVEGLDEGDYQFVVWSGLGNEEYAVTGDMLPLEQFRLSLARRSDGYNGQLHDLFYGSLNTVHYDNAYAVHDVQMMKDNNSLACLIVPLDSSEEIEPGEYTMKVISANGTMDAHNRLMSDEAVTYRPFAQDTVIVDDIDYGLLHGIKFGISTLRLMEDTDCRLVLEKSETGETVFNISLPEYIGMIGSLYTNLGRPLTVQEYLDRQDFYTIVFFLSGANLDQLLQLQVNSWRLRAYHHLKL